MSNIYMLDTNICSYIIRENPKSVVEKLWEHREDELVISSITYSELMYGAIRKGSSRIIGLVKVFTSRMRIVDFDEKAGELYADMRALLEKKGTPIDNMDILIAACAKSANAILVTNNKKHFSKIPNLKIENWC